MLEETGSQKLVPCWMAFSCRHRISSIFDGVFRPLFYFKKMKSGRRNVFFTMENILSLDERINSTAQDHNTAPKYVQTTTGQGKLEFSRVDNVGWTINF